MDWRKHRYYPEALENVKLFSASMAEARIEIEALKSENIILRSQLPSEHEREFGRSKTG